MLANPTRSVPFLLHDISRHARYRFDARTRGMGVTRAQWRVLLTLSRLDRPTQSDLAERLDVERITLCRLIDRLAEAGLVERHADPADRRVWRLELTERAAPLVEELSGISVEVEQEMLAPLSPDQRETLNALLLTVRNHMREADGEILAKETRR